MFNFSKKKNTNDPIAEAFSDSTHNQKISVVNFLMTLALCDNEGGKTHPEEIKILNSYLHSFNLGSRECLSYLEKGNEVMTNDIRLLNQNQKSILGIAGLDMIMYDGNPNTIELNIASALFNEVGLDIEQILKDRQKLKTIQDHFNI